MEHIVIIGNGISGITCARHIRKMSDQKITVISSESKHFYSRTALMYIFMGHMKFEHTKPYEDWFWEKNNINLINTYVNRVDTINQVLYFDNYKSIHFDKFIIASGSKSNEFVWPGQDLKGVQGLYHLQDLHLMEENSKGIKQAVIVGGGLIGIEMAEMLLSRNIHVTFLVRENSFWNLVLPPEESEMINRHIQKHHINLKLETELNKIRGDVNGIVKEIETNNGEVIPCQFVGLTVGVSPNIDFLKDSGIETQRGVLINEFFETNINNIYAIGDCAQFRNPLPGRRPVEQVWYTGRMHGETLAQTICKTKTSYQPGNWFNSAKFFDIEYQTYGDIPAQLSERQKTFYWEDLSGDRCIRINYDENNGTVKGFNAMGIRLRHPICDKWINEKKSIKYVLENFGEANFDAEFSRGFAKKLLNKYNNENGEILKLKSKKGSESAIEYSFLIQSKK